MIKTFHGWMNILKETYWTEKSHICEEDGPHLRISFWHLSDEPWKNWKWQKIAGDIFILHMCTKNHNHMRCSSWDTEWDRIFCHFGPFFALLTPSPPNNPDKQNFEKMKKAAGEQIDRLTDGRTNWWWFLLCKCLCSFPMASFVLFKM